MSEKWELYHQGGPDGLEWGVRVRPGYVVTGFTREDAEAVVAWQNAAVSRPAGDVLERAKRVEYPDSALKILPELIVEVERLQDFRGRIARILGQSEGDCDDLLVLGLDAAIKIPKRQATRIKELEAVLADMSRRAERLLVTVQEDEAYRDRLEAAFLEAEERVLWDEVWVDGPKENRAKRHIAIVQQKAREALEKIRSGEKDE